MVELVEAADSHRQEQQCYARRRKEISRHAGQGGDDHEYQSESHASQPPAPSQFERGQYLARPIERLRHALSIF
jgi:hypothetical protein